MNITLSIDDEMVEEARKVAESMGKSLNQLVREELEKLTRKHHLDEDLNELRSLDGMGNSSGWKFNREELHERS